MTIAEGPQLSVVIPVLNDADVLCTLLQELDPGVHPALEVVIADGGSDDQPGQVAQGGRVRLISAPRGRGAQLAAGAAAAEGRWLWFLHADSTAIGSALAYLLTLAPGDVPPDHSGWGRFDVQFDESGPALNLVAFMMAWRSRMSGVCTGDQGIFVHRQALQRAGGMPVQPLMEDIELSRRLKRQGAPEARRERITTSARRWRGRGVARTIMAMWWYRLRYWLGADPEHLARSYYR